MWPAGSWPGFGSAGCLLSLVCCSSGLYYYRLSATVTKSCKFFSPSLSTLCNFFLISRVAWLTKAMIIAAFVSGASGFIGVHCLKASLTPSKKALDSHPYPASHHRPRPDWEACVAAWTPAPRVWRWTRGLSLPSAELCALGGKNGFSKGGEFLVMSCQARMLGTWSGGPSHLSLKIMALACKIIGRWEVASRGYPTSKVGHSDMQ